MIDFIIPTILCLVSLPNTRAIDLNDGMKIPSGITVSINSEFFQEYRHDILKNF